MEKKNMEQLIEWYPTDKIPTQGINPNIINLINGIPTDKFKVYLMCVAGMLKITKPRYVPLLTRFIANHQIFEYSNEFMLFLSYLPYGKWKYSIQEIRKFESLELSDKYKIIQKAKSQQLEYDSERWYRTAETLINNYKIKKNG